MYNSVVWILDAPL